MRELAFAALWLFFAVGLFIVEPDARGDSVPYVAHGKWLALAMAGMNALRPVVKWGSVRLMKRLGWISLPPEKPAPPKPILHPEFQIIDDRIQNPPPPPGAIRR
jgi:hypothetical protein